MTKKDRNILIISLIALVNMLGYGIIVPILYAYSKKFGMSDFQNGLLFAAFSVCQFISTPIIGRLSDKYGRRPLLLISITGTAISFFMMAYARSATMLFAARALDGITAGNIPVALAVISDTTKIEERTKAFGKIGAAFNFGFVFGPAISALTLGLGMKVPFIIAGIVTLFAVILTYFYLPETNKHMGEVQKGKLFDIPKLWNTLFDKHLGKIFLISLVYFTAFACAIIYGFQPFTINVLKITPTLNSILFTIFGVVGLITQTFLIDRVSKKYGIQKSFSSSMIFAFASVFLMFLTSSLVVFVLAMIILSFANSISQTLIPAILSRFTDEKSQGSIMGLNASYQSIGLIIGPILGGAIATLSIKLPFIMGSVLILICYYLSSSALRSHSNKESAF